MICTFGDLTDVTWWRELELPDAADRRLGRSHHAPSAPDGVARVERRLRAVRRARGQDRSSRRSARIVELLRETGDLARRAPPDHARGEVLREGRPSARDHHHPPVVLPQRRSRRRSCATRCSRAVASCTGIPATCRPATRAGSRDSTATGSSAASASSACRSRCGTRSTPRASPTTTGPLVPAEDALPVDPQSDAPPGYAEDQRGEPGRLRRPTPTSWTRGPRRRSRRRSRASGATDPDLFARTYPMDLRPQAHEIIRTWLFSTVVRAHSRVRRPALDRRRDLRLGARPRPQEDVEVEGQRRHAARPARAVRLRRGALLGRERSARHRHRVRRGPDEDRSAARDQGAQRVEVRARRDR